MRTWLHVPLICITATILEYCFCIPAVYWLVLVLGLGFGIINVLTVVHEARARNDAFRYIVYTTHSHIHRNIIVVKRPSQNPLWTNA